MPYFKDKNLLFIHIPKTAGMYIEKVLELPKKIVSYAQPTDYPIRDYFASDEKDTIRKTHLYDLNAGQYYFQHTSLTDLLDYKLLPESDLEKSILFTVHRHPLDRALSIYKYWGINTQMNFEDFCIRFIDEPRYNIVHFGLLMHLKTQYSYVRGDEKYSSKINLLRFSNLTEDLKSFSEKYNLNLELEANKINASKDINIDVTTKAKKIIENHYKEDFEFFNYSL